MATQFTLGQSASCTDGSCGVVSRLILDPVARTLTHLVIEPRHRSADGRLIPVDLVEGTDGQIRLRCTMAEFDQLDPAEEVEPVDAPVYGEEAAIQSYADIDGMGIGGTISGIGAPVSPGPYMIVSDTVPSGETDFVRHERVHAADGEIGRIEGFVVDRADRKVTHVLLAEGHLWGRKEVAIPVSAVASMENGIWLTITKDQLGELPPRDRP
ncbi:MAG: hypothetical protein JO132_19270 [Streptosporangiaceae bacterium]|nr:hypothetical protein [Streptosporangiaceae bacterium]